MKPQAVVGEQAPAPLQTTRGPCTAHPACRLGSSRLTRVRHGWATTTGSRARSLSLSLSLSLPLCLSLSLSLSFSLYFSLSLSLILSLFLIARGALHLAAPEPWKWSPKVICPLGLWELPRQSLRRGRQKSISPQGPRFPKAEHANIGKFELIYPLQHSGVVTLAVHSPERSRSALQGYLAHEKHPPP